MNSRRRILFTTFDGLPSDAQGGPNNIISKLLKSLNKRKYQPDFLSYRNYIENAGEAAGGRFKPDSKKIITDYLYYNTRVYRMLTANSVYLKRHFKLRDSFFGKYNNSSDYDVIHSHDTLSHYYFAGNVKALKVLTIHGNGSIENDWADAALKSDFVRNIMPELKQREIKSFNTADIVTFPGQFAKELFLNDYGNALSKDKDIRIINNGIDAGQINEITPEKNLLEKFGRRKEHDLVLLSVAGHIRQKNIGTILGVISILKTKGINPLLINAGYGHLTPEIKRLIKKYKLEGNVTLAGKVSHDVVISLMKSVDAMIMLSDRTIFDIVLLEATACGIPIVTDLSGGNGEILNGYEGLIETDKRNTEHTADLIKQKLRAGRKNKIDNKNFIFTLGKMLKEYEGIYEISGYKK